MITLDDSIPTISGTRNNVDRLDQLANQDVEGAWEDFVGGHIIPSRMFLIASGSKKLVDAECQHLFSCESCRRVFDKYVDEFDSGVSISATNEPKGENAAKELNDHVDSVVIDESHSSILGEVKSSLIPRLIREHLHTDGFVVFPDAYVTASSWQFGNISRIRQSNQYLAEQLIDLLATSALEASRLKFQMDRLVIICFGREIHRCGTRIARRLVDVGRDAPHVILAHDFYSPSFVCAPKELLNANVLVMVDVVHTGGLLRRLMSACEPYNPASVSGFTFIDKSAQTSNSSPWDVVWYEESDKCIPLEEFVAKEQNAVSGLERFEPNSQTVVLAETITNYFASDSSPVEQHLELEPTLVEFIHLTDAFKQDYEIAGKRFPFAVNVLDLLKKNKDSCKYVLDRCVGQLLDLTGENVCITYDLARTRRAGVLGKLLSERLHWPVVPIGSHRGEARVFDKQTRELARYDHVVVVDAAVRTGDSMTAISRAIDDVWLRKHTKIHALFVLDALAQESLSILSANTGVDIRTVFKLPLSPPTEQVRHWANARKKMLVEKMANHGEFSKIVEALGKYLKPNRPFGHGENRSLEEVESGICNAIRSAQFPVSGVASVSEACLKGKAHSIRHLPVDEVVHDSRVQDVLFGVMFNSMPPSFKENAAYALAAASNFEWMNLDWLKCNRPFLTAQSQSWKSIVMVECEMKMRNMKKELERFREAIVEYRGACSVSSSVAEYQRVLPGMEGCVNETKEPKKAAVENERMKERLDLMIAATE